MIAAFTGVMMMIRRDGSLVAYNQHVKIKNARRRHMLNVQLPTREQGSKLKHDIERRTKALEGSSGRVFDGAELSVHLDIVDGIRDTTPHDVLDIERRHRHIGFRNKQRFYAMMMNKLASLSILGGDPLILLGDGRL